ncbi:MAG: FAD-dependent oxidoreductase, partial [Lentisphaerae bacterium]|nr:FAD-dependent oxidoreductase [Lentisphaerota bacterium]
VDTAATRLEPLDDPGLGLTLEAVHLASLDGVPHEPGADVLVAGAGTAGAPAALAALEAGATTAVVEQLSDPGGTQTIGLVGGYYHGYRGGITARLDAEQAALAERLHPGRGGVRRLLRMAHYLDAIVRHGGRWYPGAVVCGGVVDGDRVRGLLVADREGLVVLPAAVTLDATGDGDAAAACGVAASFGDARSGNAQDCSQWSLGRGGAEAVASDLDVIDQRLLSEVLRGQRLAHRLGRHFDFTGMLTVREGRHIEGETTLDLRDVFSGRCFEDTIAVACSDWDPHGPSASWLGRLGFLPLQTVELPVRVPLRCCIPRGRRGLMVTAKAISATPDAACLCRMVPDIQNLGYATGLAAAMAATADGDPRRIDVAALVGRLRDLGIVVDRLATPWPGADPPEGAVARLAAGDEMALRDLVLATPAAAVPLLEAAFAAAPEGPGRLQLAKGLAWFGSRRGETLLVAALRDLAASERWPCDDGHPHKPGKPRAGMVDGPDDYWRLNQLLVLLGLCRAVDAAAAVAAVIDRTDAGGAPSTGINPYFRGRIDMRRVPHFDRLLSIAFCAERLGEPCLAAPLEALLEREFVGGYAHRGLDGAGQRYQGALAEVHLAAAATRCGSLDAARRLAGFCA